MIKEEDSTIWVFVEEESIVESKSIGGQRSSEDIGGGFDPSPTQISDRTKYRDKTELK